jgi:hypothetical protein
VASDSGLLQPWLGAENAELPQEETDESEKEEQTDPERSNAGLSLLRLSLIKSHSCARLSIGELNPGCVRGAGVRGGVTRRNGGSAGASRPSIVGVGRNIGLDMSFTASDISIVGIGVSDVGSASC